MDKKLNLFHYIKTDLRRYYETWESRGVKSPNKFRIILESFIFKAGFQAVFMFRLCQFFYRIKLSYIAWLLARLNLFFTGAEIEFNVEIGEGMMIAHPSGIVLGRGSKIGNRVTLYQGVTMGVKDLKPENIKKFPSLGDNVTLFSGSKVIGDVHVGDNSSVGANSVVVNDVPPNSVAVGIPAAVKTPQSL